VPSPPSLRKPAVFLEGDVVADAFEAALADLVEIGCSEIAIC
jgi:hypothetical protein